MRTRVNSPQFSFLWLVNLGGRNQRWKDDDNRSDRADKRDARRNRDRKQSDVDSKDTELEQSAETDRDSNLLKKRTASVSSSQHSVNETDADCPGAATGETDSADVEKQETEASSEADLGRV